MAVFAVLDECQNPNRCRKIAVNEVEVRNAIGDTIAERKLCAYCTSALKQQIEEDISKAGWKVVEI